MIDFKFINETKFFFKIQQFIFVFFCFAPIFSLIYTDRDSHWTIPCLVVSMIGELFFLGIEIINAIQQGIPEYLDELSNIGDNALFFSHLIYFFLKLVDYNDAVRGDEGSDGAHNIMYIIQCFMIVAFLTKFMHLIKIYLSYGRLTVLITDSINKVIPFMVIFLLWTLLFAT